MASSADTSRATDPWSRREIAFALVVAVVVLPPAVFLARAAFALTPTLPLSVWAGTVATTGLAWWFNRRRRDHVDIHRIAWTVVALLAVASNIAIAWFVASLPGPHAAGRHVVLAPLIVGSAVSGSTLSAGIPIAAWHFGFTRRPRTLIAFLLLLSSPVVTAQTAQELLW